MEKKHCVYNDTMTMSVCMYLCVFVPTGTYLFLKRILIGLDQNNDLLLPILKKKKSDYIITFTYQGIFHWIYFFKLAFKLKCYEQNQDPIQMVHNFKVDAGFFHFLAKFSLIVNIHELYETSTTSRKHHNSTEHTAIIMQLRLEKSLLLSGKEAFN